ncbi:hypothetical protein MTO96_050448, partial [Rhipicephalus appendiculatus]
KQFRRSSWLWSSPTPWPSSMASEGGFRFGGGSDSREYDRDYGYGGERGFGGDYGFNRGRDIGFGGGFGRY